MADETLRKSMSHSHHGWPVDGCSQVHGSNVTSLKHCQIGKNANGTVSVRLHQATVARIGQGTWFIEEAERTAAIAALRRGLDLGMTHIDTAELYGGAQRRNWWAKRSPGGATRFSLSRRCFPNVPLTVRNTPGVRAFTRPSQYTAWTVTCCIGVAGTYSRIWLQGSKMFGARARFSPGGQ